MKKADPLQLAHGHLAVAARAALDFHRALSLAYRESTPAQQADFSLILLAHGKQMRHIALLFADVPHFFAGNLPASLNAAADNWRP